ncbi:hypothetical protein A5740_00410 [Mycobacterium sp. GA-1841]|nr:hypothetical protein A5740_00410 [Mycobacterium sp. GA-1841]
MTCCCLKAFSNNFVDRLIGRLQSGVRYAGICATEGKFGKYRVLLIKFILQRGAKQPFPSIPTHQGTSPVASRDGKALIVR